MAEEVKNKYDELTKTLEEEYKKKNEDLEKSFNEKTKAFKDKFIEDAEKLKKEFLDTLKSLENKNSTLTKENTDLQRIDTRHRCVTLNLKESKNRTSIRSTRCRYNS